MPVPLLLTFVSTVAFAIQLLIFAYLYSSHRVRFFQYLLLAWGAYTLSKGLKLVDMVVFDLEQPGVVTGVATVAAVGFMLAAAFAYRWDYRLRGRDLLVGGAFALLLSLANDVGGADEGLRLVGVGLGAVQMVAGALFWPPRPSSWSAAVDKVVAGADDGHRRLMCIAAGNVDPDNFTTYPDSNITDSIHDPGQSWNAVTVGAIRTEARRLNRILSDFLQFARPQQVRRTSGDIREVVQHVSALIRDDRSRAPRVDVKVAVDPAVPRFAFDRDQVTQVLWNVALNSVQAMNGRGRLSLEVAREGGHVALAVSDTGPGIPHELLPRVFEPFYSGKPNGSGLGLTIAERIVAAHGGRIEIDTAPGSGTRVTLRFPIEAV